MSWKPLNSTAVVVTVGLLAVGGYPVRADNIIAGTTIFGTVSAIDLDGVSIEGGCDPSKVIRKLWVDIGEIEFNQYCTKPINWMTAIPMIVNKACPSGRRGYMYVQFSAGSVHVYADSVALDGDRFSVVQSNGLGELAGPRSEVLRITYSQVCTDDVVAASRMPGWGVPPDFERK